MPTGRGRSIALHRSPAATGGRGRPGHEPEVTTSEPRRIGEILNPALTRLDTTDQARAYGAWARAAGEVVAANARPRSFARGLLTVECASPIWAQELTYLGGQILSRMAELDPAHPVERLRFVARGVPAGYAAQPAAGAVVDEALPAGLRMQENEPASAKESRRDETLQRADLGAAREGARQVGDERLRSAIQAALAAAADGPPASTSGGPSVNPEK